MKYSGLSETEFWILVALSENPSHGYAVVERVRELSNGEAVLRVPTLYAALERLERSGAVALDRDEVVSGRLRRYFRITKEGSAGLAEEVSRIERKAALASRVLGAATPSFGIGGTARS